MRGRDELARAIADARAGRYDRLVFLRMDRIARNLRDLLHICDTLESAGVDMVGIHDPVDLSTPFGRAVRSFSGLFAELDRDLIRERVREGISQKARQGEIVGPLSIGYLRSESGNVEIDPAVAPLIREAFTRYSTGAYSLKDMAEWADYVGLLSRRGRPLHRLSIRKMLTNPAYAGRVVLHRRSGNGETFDGQHPPIIDRDLVDAVQKTLARRRRFESPKRPWGNVPYPLSGAVCAYCRKGLTGCSRTVEGRYKYEYYRCSTAQLRGKAACEQPMVRTYVFEDQMAAYLGGMVLPAEYLGEVVAQVRRRRQPDFAGEARKLEREIDRWRRHYVLGEVDEERLRHELAPLKRRLAEIDRPQELLARMLAELEPIEAIDLSLSGFSEDEIGKLLKSMDARERRDRPEEFDLDAAWEAATGDPGVKRGDVFQLGSHRLICGDSADTGDVSRLMAGQTATLMVTDPPYGVAYAPEGRRRKRPIANDALGEGQAAFWTRAFAPWPLEGDAYVFSPSGPLIQTLCAAIVAAGIEHHQWLIWVKDRLVLGHSNYHYRHEHVFYGWKGKTSWQGSRKEDSVWEEERPQASPQHPTMKPVALCVRAIENSSGRDDVVADPFLGSGTTLIAAERTGRRCYGMEIDPRYCRVAINRWEAFTGERAVLETDGAGAQ